MEIKAKITISIENSDIEYSKEKIIDKLDEAIMTSGINEVIVDYLYELMEQNEYPIIKVKNVEYEI